MLAKAKDDLYCPEYNYQNWRKGKEYPCVMRDDLIDIADEKGVVFHFSQKIKSKLEEVFEFVEGI
jgi:hypothetical protein